MCLCILFCLPHAARAGEARAEGKSSIDRALSPFDRLRAQAHRRQRHVVPGNFGDVGPGWLVKGMIEVMVLLLRLEHIWPLLVLCICHIQHVFMVDPTMNYFVIFSIILLSSDKFCRHVSHSTIIP